MEILEPVRNGMPAPLEVKSCRLLTGRGFLTGWRESVAKTQQLEMLQINYSAITIVFIVSYDEYKFLFLTPS